MKKILLLIFFLSSVLISNSQGYKLADAKINFFIKNATITVEGHFDDVEANLELAKDKWNKASLSGKLPPETINTGIKLRDKHLRNDDYFDVENFPYINMQSLEITKTDRKTLNAKFLLTIKDFEKELDFPIHYLSSKDGIKLEGQFTINRLDFELGGKSVILSQDVLIKFIFDFKED